MTPEQKIKYAILAKNAEWSKELAPEFPCADVDALYDTLVEQDEHWDAKNEIRCGEVETKLPSPYSRYLESREVAMRFPDGSWVGWTYWYGGGKYAEPEAIDWMSEAYDVSCSEEERVVTVRTFMRNGE